MYRAHTMLQARQQPSMSSLTFNLLIALLILASISLVCFSILVVIRRLRQHRQPPVLPSYNEYMTQSGNGIMLHSVGTESVIAMHGKHPMVRHDSGPLPEIHIHTPAEVDESGQQSPAKVEVVRFGYFEAPSNTVGEALPPYRPRASETSQARDGFEKAPI